MQQWQRLTRKRGRSGQQQHEEPAMASETSDHESECTVERPNAPLNAEHDGWREDRQYCSQDGGI